MYDMSGHILSDRFLMQSTVLLREHLYIYYLKGHL